MMDTNAFSSLAVIKLPSACRVVASACCPDKDLIVLISRIGGKDKLSLWKLQGSKKWEVAVGTDEMTSEEIVDISWSPGGDSIAIAHDPPRITVHSAQDGSLERVLPSIFLQAGPDKTPRINALWWFAAIPKVTAGDIPDIFKRGDIIAGSSHAVLKTLPLLDHIQDAATKTTATDLFAFQGSQTKVTPKSTMPPAITTWPTLLLDPTKASISPSVLRANQPPQRASEVLDEVDNTNLNSILAVSDDKGRLHYFLDGSYPLGAVSLTKDSAVQSLFKDPDSHAFLVHSRRGTDPNVHTELLPSFIEAPFLDQRHARDMAQLSSTARELTWYTIRVVREMRDAWWGTGKNDGARNLGPKWVSDLAIRQKDFVDSTKFGHDPVFDLTQLLLTGKPSAALSDFIGSAPQMSERGTQRWESVVSEALIKLRDYSDKRLAPACQRLHLILDELLGWSQLPQFAQFELQKEEIVGCLELTTRAIVASSWLADFARQELGRFTEFMVWLRWETACANPATEVSPPMRHDLLEVNHYFQHGLVESFLDKWFTGPAPKFTPELLDGSNDKAPLDSVIFTAHTVLANPPRMAWDSIVKPRDIASLDRNLDELLTDLSTRCQRIFARACGATTRAASISNHVGSAVDGLDIPKQVSRSTDGLIARERNVLDKEAGQPWQYLTLYKRDMESSFFCVVRISSGKRPFNQAQRIEFAVLDCHLVNEEETSKYICVEQLDFFDDEEIVLIYGARGEDGPLYLATIDYQNLVYNELPVIKDSSREELFVNIFSQSQQLFSTPVPIKKCRELVCGGAGPSLAVNGREGRRVACVLDDKGLNLEVIDMEGDSEADVDEE